MEQTYARGGRGKKIVNKILKNQMKCSFSRRPIIVAALTTVVCLAIIGGFFTRSSDDNFFAIKTYALEEVGGAIAMREIDLLDQPEVLGGYYDSESKRFYVSVGLRYEGENIERVEFITTEGFFAKQYLAQTNPIEDSIPRLYVGAENRLVVCGTDFEIAGSQIILDEKTQPDDLLLFWGTELADRRDIPNQIEIVAIAAFADGKMQEQRIVIDLTGVGLFTFSSS